MEKYSGVLPKKHPDRYNWEQVTESVPIQTSHAEKFDAVCVKMADEGFITA